MKKLKYLIGLFVVGLCFFSQGFCNILSSLYVEGITLPSVSNSNLSAGYQYKFNLSREYRAYTSQMDYFLGYQLYYDGSTKFNLSQYKGESSCPESAYSIFNNSIFGYSSYTGSCINYVNRVHYYQSQNAGYNSDLSNITIIFGQGSNKGKSFVYSSLSTGFDSPKYSLGYGFMQDNDLLAIYSSNIKSAIRIFYDRNVNLSSPLDGFDLSTNYGSNMNTGFYAWSYFVPAGMRFQTKYNSSPKLLSDYGSQYTKGRHFGGYGMGYSYAMILNGSNTITWNDFEFASLGSRCSETDLQLGQGIGSTGCQVPGVLILRGDSYVSFNNGQPAIVLAKNPNNMGQILYETFDCYEDDPQKLFNSSDCNVVSKGIISINGSTSVLPFINGGSYTIGGSNGLLNYLLTGSYYGYISFDELNNSYILGGPDNSLSFSLVPSASISSIKDLYLNGNLGLDQISTSQAINQQYITKCLNDQLFYKTHQVFCDPFISQLNGNITAMGSGLYYQYTYDSSGNLVMEIIDQAGLFSGTYMGTGTVWIQDQNGNWVSNCDGGWCNDFDPNKVSFDSSFVSGGLISTGYFSFDNTKLFFNCPYPYENYFDFKYNLTIGNFDLFMPLKCFIGAFKYGMNYSFLESTNVFVDGYTLMSGNSQNHRSLFAFFDGLLSFALFMMLMWFYKLFK